MASHLYFVDSPRHIWTNTSCNNAVYCFWLYCKDLECLPRSPEPQGENRFFIDLLEITDVRQRETLMNQRVPIRDWGTKYLWARGKGCVSGPSNDLRNARDWLKSLRNIETGQRQTRVHLERM